MLSLSRRYCLANLIDKWAYENGMAPTAGSVLRYLDANGLLNGGKIAEHLDRHIRLEAARREKEEKSNDT